MSKSNGSSAPASQNTGKQSTLLGFFTKNPATKTGNGASSSQQARLATPATPSSATTETGSDGLVASSSSGVKPASSKQSAIPSKKQPASTPASGSIDLSSDGIEGEQPPRLSSSSSALKAKSMSNATSSLAHLKSKPAVNSASQPPPKLPTPPYTSEGDDNGASTSASGALTSASEMDVDDDEDEPMKRKPSGSRISKRSIVDSEEESGNSSAGPSKKQKVATKATKSKGKEASPFMLSSGEDDEDDFNDREMDWDEAIQVADRSQASKKGKGPVKPAASAKSKAAPKKTASKTASASLFQTSADLEKEGRKVDYASQGETFDFLKEGNVKDANKVLKDTPGYDPRTLYIPPGAENKFTPFEKQFWDIKKKHFDTVLFFQKGKFFELYENDADIGHQVFDLKMTGRVKMRMVGVPESTIDYWIAKFLAQGYKVGRVEQAETALGADLRRKEDASDKAKIVNRQLKTVLTTGTIVDGNLLTDELSNHCISVKEYIAEPGADPRFGIVIADCSTAEFTMSAFQDDTCRTKLETTIRQHRPKELICEKGNLSVPTLRLLRSCVGPSCTWNNLEADKEFLSAKEAIKGVDELFQSDEDDEEGSQVPEAIRNMYDNHEAMSAMGGMLWYLKGLNLDKDLFAVKNFNIFDPIRDGHSLILDGQTLAHIEVLQNSLGTDEATLFKLLCRCSTAFGKRLFKIWVCQPLLQAKAINDRLDAVEDLMQGTAFVKTFERHAKKYPDLERLLSRIHARNCRVKDFLAVLAAFEQFPNLVEDLKNAASDFASSGILRLLRSAPELEALVTSVKEMFYEEEGELKPQEGHDDEYDAIDAKVQATEKELQDLLKRYKKELKCPEMVFKDIGTKDIYQIQVPTGTKVPKDWTKMSNTQALNRYYSPKSSNLVDELKEYKERRDQASKVFQYKVYGAFSNDYHTWLEAVKIIAEIDCLVSLASASSALGEPAVRPEIVDARHAFVEFEELRHPCVVSATSDFIPNDVKLGGDEKKMVLLTGPNMAGKSTLLRMSCIGVIMAQIGCYVPASKARISPCDRIVSRMGASDNMLAGQSTFRVEMEDCKKILVESTPKTLVILDELGRGTSTFDGLSIAFAVLHQLATHLGCIGFFATHFTSLTGDFAAHPQVVLKHMQTFVDEATREVTFLYRLTDGCSPKSYGPHVASLAGVPRSIVERAIDVSKSFEDRTLAREASKKKDQVLSLDLQADTSYLMKLAAKEMIAADPLVLDVLQTIRAKLDPFPAVPALLNDTAMETDA